MLGISDGRTCGAVRPFGVIFVNLMPLFTVGLYILLVPLVFSLLSRLRLEEAFRKGSHPWQVTLLYIVLTLAISRLVIDYFTGIFSLLGQVFNI